MCEILEQMRDETKQYWMQQGLEQGLEQGIEHGSQQTLLDNVRNMVLKLGMSAQEALDILNVRKSDWSRIIPML